MKTKKITILHKKCNAVPVRTAFAFSLRRPKVAAKKVYNKIAQKSIVAYNQSVFVSFFACCTSNGFFLHIIHTYEYMKNMYMGRRYMVY